MVALFKGGLQVINIMKIIFFLNGGGVVVVGQLPPARRPKESRRGVPCRTGSLRQGRKRSGRERRTDAACEITNVYSSKSELYGAQNGT